MHFEWSQEITHIGGAVRWNWNEMSIIFICSYRFIHDLFCNIWLDQKNKALLPIFFFFSDHPNIQQYSEREKELEIIRIWLLFTQFSTLSVTYFTRCDQWNRIKLLCASCYNAIAMGGEKMKNREKKMHWMSVKMKWWKTKVDTQQQQKSSSLQLS